MSEGHQILLVLSVRVFKEARVCVRASLRFLPPRSETSEGAAPGAGSASTPEISDRPRPRPWSPGPGVDQRGARPWPTLCYQTGPEHRRHNYTVIPVKRRAGALTGTCGDSGDDTQVINHTEELQPEAPGPVHLSLSAFSCSEI